MLKKSDLNNGLLQEEVQTDSYNLPQAEVIQLLKQVIEPTLKNDIVSLGMVRNLRIFDQYIYLRLYIGSRQQHLEAKIKALLSLLAWCKKLIFKFVQLQG